jgi:hypothetical protein
MGVNIEKKSQIVKAFIGEFWLIGANAVHRCVFTGFNGF